MTKAEAPLLKIHDLHVEFHSMEGCFPAVRGVDLEIDVGETVALVGESGCGKSVTAQAILQLLGTTGKITKGQIWLGGIELNSLNQRQMREVRGKRIGMVFQDSMAALNPTMVIGKQIAEGILYHEKVGRRQAREQTMQLLHQVGIPDPAARFDSYPFQLSGGMRQRVAIAMALACRPSLLIADEPTTALDVTVQAQILDLIKKICRETRMSLLLITHDLGVVAGMCDRVAVMHEGRIVEIADVEELFYRPKNEYTKKLLESKKPILV